MVGRGVFLDVARALGKDFLDDGYGITCDDLDLTAKKQKIAFKRGDYIIVRTGQMERCLKAGSWDGYPGGDAPGFAFETLEFVAKTELAALASDTRGCEVRPNHPDHGHDHGRDFLSQGPRRGLRRRRRLRIHVRRAGYTHHGSRRLADQPAGDQVISPVNGREL